MSDVITPTLDELDKLSYQEHETYRRTGKMPEPPKAEEGKTEESSAAAEEAAKTVPESETGKEQEQEGETQQEGEGDKPKPKGGFQRRIDKLTQEKFELSGRVQELERQLAGKPAVQPESKPQAEGRPRLEEFETLEAFQEALTDWKVDQRFKAEREAEAKRKADEERGAKVATWQQRLEAAREKYEDFDDALEIPLTPAMQDVILESEHGAELAYWLAKNPAEAQRIRGLNPLAAARALGKIEADVAKPTEKAAPKQKPVSQAPAPIKPVSGANASPTPKPLDQADFSEYERRRRAGEGR